LRLFRLIKHMMKYIFVFLTVIAFMLSCKPGQEKAKGNNIQIVDYEGLKPYLERESDTIYLINFWATWCKPCVDELPYFETINANYQDKKLKVLLVSLDFPEQIETRLKPFIQEQNLKSQIILLDDGNSNYWIEQIDSRWSGAIPATVIYGNGFRDFYEKTFKFPELDSIVKSKL
jgi:thiol-disulfide isomerase/thioredoxin